MRARFRGAGAAVLLLLPSTASAQGLAAEVGRYFDGDGWTAYRLTYERPFLGPLGLQFSGNAFTGPGDRSRTLWGAGADLTLFKGGRPGLYAVGGVLGGFKSGGGDGTWGSWSAGLGYEWLPFDFLSIGTEARWRELSVGRTDGLELSVRLGARWGSRRSSGRAPRPVDATSAGGSTVPLATAGTGALPPAEPAAGAPVNVTPGTAASVRRAIIATARAELGTRYQYGGTGQGDDGFDCSGLIQYAYATHGIHLPRTSAEQARRGRPIERRLDRLEPGDLLTFSNRGGPVTHVGMYLGDGRFIHSATRGVQESRLSPDDPYGRWWWNRWVGVRRIVE